MKKAVLIIFFLLLSSCSSVATQENINFGDPIKNASPEIINEISKKAEQGDSDSQTALGLMYLEGNGVKKDAKKAFSLFHQAALKGHPIATFYMGLMCIRVEGTPRNSIEAIKWLKKSSDCGNAVAESLLNEYFGQRIKWKTDNKTSKVYIVLEDKFGNWFPNKSAIDGLDKEDILHLNSKKNNEVSMILFLENCSLNKNGLCTERYDFAIFNPDWELQAEFTDNHPNFKIFLCKSNRNIVYSKLLKMTIKPEDKPGNYRMIVRIHQGKKKFMNLSICLMLNFLSSE